MSSLLQIAAAVYLAAGVGALVGATLPSARMARGAVWGLALGAAVHALAYASLHSVEPPPPLTGLPASLSVAAWLGNLFLLGFLWRHKIQGLVAAAGPISFLAVFVAALHLPGSEPTASPADSGAMPHAHILLAGAGIALLGLAGMAGIAYLIEYRRLKAKRALVSRVRLPSLEALDRVNSASLAVGFPLLTLSLVTGMLWLADTRGVLWTGGAHETWCAIAWAIYAGLCVARFGGRQGARGAAASAVAGSAFLLFGVVAVGWLV